jgi:putative DNA primase/helicase
MNDRSKDNSTENQSLVEDDNPFLALAREAMNDNGQWPPFERWEKYDPAPYTEAVDFLEQLRPGGPWVLTAIIPDGKTETITARNSDQVRKFVIKHDGKRNLYYSVNPTRKPMTSKASKADIAAIEYLSSDLDPKDGETPEAAKVRYIAALEVMEPKPFAIVDSGNGIQVLHRLAERIELPKPTKEVLPPQIADVESRVKLLIETLGSKAGTQNIDRILRLPGTINLPNAKKIRDGRVQCPTKLIRLNDTTCKLEDFPAPQPQGKTTSDDAPPNNFQKASLSDDLMSLIRDGAPVGQRSEQFMNAVGQLYDLGWTEDAIIKLLADHPSGIRSKYKHYWKREVRRCCAKLANKPQVEEEPDKDAPDAAATKGKIILDPNNPIKSARMLLAEAFTDPDGLKKLHRHRGAFWQWTGSYYREADDETIMAEFWTFLEKAYRKEKAKDEWKLVPFKPNRAKVGDAVAALNAVTQLDKYVEPAAWLTPTDLPPPNEFLACANGLLHLPTGEMYPPTPDYFNISASEVVFDPSAPPPVLWLAFLDQLFEGDEEAKQLLQEWFGYSLAPDTSQQKILLIVGPKRCGKGTIGRVKTALLGKNSVAGPTMSSLADQFGLEPLITKPTAIISDARIGTRTDKSAIVERLLAISGEDTLTVARKYKSAWNGKLPSRFTILTNELPSLSDGSGALANRFIILMLIKSFFGKEDRELTKKVLAELSGILNWSIEGYRRLQQRGHFKQPQSSLKAVDDIEMLASPVIAFVRDRCDLGPAFFTATTDDLWSEWQMWCEDQGKKDAGSRGWFFRNLQSAFPGLTSHKPMINGKQTPSYAGIAVKEEPPGNPFTPFTKPKF